MAQPQGGSANPICACSAHIACEEEDWAIKKMSLWPQVKKRAPRNHFLKKMDESLVFRGAWATEIELWAQNVAPTRQFLAPSATKNEIFVPKYTFWPQDSAHFLFGGVARCYRGAQRHGRRANEEVESAAWSQNMYFGPFFFEKWRPGLSFL